MLTLVILPTQEIEASKAELEEVKVKIETQKQAIVSDINDSATYNSN